MGKKYIVEFEYCKGLLDNYKKSTMLVDAYSDKEALSSAERVLKAEYRYVKVISAHPSSGYSEEKTVKWSPTIKTTTKVVAKPSFSTPKYEEPTREMTEQEKEDYVNYLKDVNSRNKQKQIDKVRKGPYISLFVGFVCSLLAFLLGWIPYWALNGSLKSIREQIEWYQKMGYDPSSEIVQEAYQKGLSVKAARDGSVCVPFILLGVALIITIIVFVYKKKHVEEKIKAIKGK